MLEIEAISVDYGHVNALSSVSAGVAEGEVVCLLGSNGAGKSTFMRALIGLVALSSGTIAFNGKRIDTLPVEDRVKLGIATVPEGRGMLPNMTVYENLQMGAYIRGKAPIGRELEWVYSLFPVLKERSGQAAGTLSGGEQQMLAIARALMLGPKLILMDEPSMGLAPVIVERVFSTIKEINNSGMTVLLVEQNARMALSVGGRFYVLQKGEVVLEGAVEDGRLISENEDGERIVLNEEELEKAYLGG